MRAYWKIFADKGGYGITLYVVRGQRCKLVYPIEAPGYHPFPSRYKAQLAWRTLPKLFIFHGQVCYVSGIATVVLVTANGRLVPTAVPTLPIIERSRATTRSATV